MQRKKLISILSVIIILVVFAAMALASGSEETTNAVSDATKEAVSDSTAAADSTAASDSTSAPANDKKAFKEAKITTGELFTWKNIKVSSTGLEKDAHWLDDGVDYKFKFLVENNENDAYKVKLHAYAINGCYESIAIGGGDVGAKKKLADEITLRTSDYGMKKLGEITLFFSISEPDSYDSLYETSVVLKTNLYDEMDRITAEGKELYNKDGIKIVAKNITKGILSKDIMVYVENSTAGEIGVQLKSLSVNGFMCDGYLLSTIVPNTYIYEDISVYDSFLEENGITDIESATFKFRIWNAETYKDIATTDEVEVKFK